MAGITREEEEEDADEIEEIDALWKCCETFRRLREVSLPGSAARMPWWWWFGVAEEGEEVEEDGGEVLCSAE